MAWVGSVLVTCPESATREEPRGGTSERLAGFQFASLPKGTAEEEELKG